MKIAVLGGGAAGLCLGRQLSRFSGTEVSVLERSSRVGGLQISPEYGGVYYDVGTFLFHESHGLLETFPEIRPKFVDIEYKPVSVTPKGGVDKYPFSIKGYIRDNGLFCFGASVLNLLASKFIHFKRDTVPSYACYYTGSMIYKRSGLQNYVCRLHDAKDTEIDVEFARKRMKAISRNSLRRTLMKVVSRGYRNKKKSQFVNRLVRPADGLAKMYDHIRSLTEEDGASVRLNCEVESITKRDGKFVLTVNGSEEIFDSVISTIPIPVALKLIGQPPGDAVETSDLVSLFYRGDFRHTASVIFNFTYDAMWKRATVFSKFYGKDKGQDYATIEATSKDTSPEAVEAIRKEFEAHAAEIGLADNLEFVDSVVVPKAYPFYRNGKMKEVERQKKQLQDFGIELVGRHGNYEYIISDVVAQRAQEMADKVASEAGLSSVTVG